MKVWRWTPWLCALAAFTIMITGIYFYVSTLKNDRFSETDIVGVWKSLKYTQAKLILRSSHEFVGIDLPPSIGNPESTDQKGKESVYGTWILSDDGPDNIGIYLEKINGQKLVGTVDHQSLTLTKDHGVTVMYFSIGDPDSNDNVVFLKQD